MAPHSDHDLGSSASNDPIPIDVPVLIIGGGPAGLLQAHLLSQLGVKSLIIERYPTRLAAPKAHALCPRSLEACRQFGIDVNDIRNLGTKREDAYWVNFVTSLAGHHVGDLPYERMDAEVLEHTPTMIHNIPQPAFEELVASRLSKDGVEIRKGHSYVDCRQVSDRVITTVEDRRAGKQYTICSTQVIACDGAKSKVRESLGVDCEGESSYDTMMTIHFNANLRSIVDKVGMLHWIMDPEVSGFIIAYDLGGNQVLICNFDSKKHPVESWNEELCRKVVTAAIGKPISFDVLSWRPWVLSRKVAKSYRVGNVFLAGDAAHSFPPTGGLGLNSGLADVHNLAWKIAAYHQGWGGDSLLSTYQYERRQVALVNLQQSVKNGIKIFSLLKSLGTTDTDLQKAKENLYHRISDPKTKRDVLEGIEGQREHFDNLGLHIGYVYGSTDIPGCASTYKPAFVPGARLPHVWITHIPSSIPQLPPIDSSYVTELQPEDVRGKEFSTLDLCALDAFTLIVDSESLFRWTQVVDAVLAQLPSTLRINVLALSKDFHLVPGAHGEEWVEALRLKDGGAVLVRPDQHILQTFRGETTSGLVLSSLKGFLGV
ncbi:hypothetical protein V500_06606 [Pseudogymnoascus sp. VKM F-4518 (FW-2643)]|nr:hypothetical protein V500_06606 [Pseudogymnoascus sp. VKM F-4518 (FW-2643)]